MAELEPGGPEEVFEPITKDGPHKIGFTRRWLARQLMDSKLDDKQAFGIVHYHPAISDVK